MIIDDELAREVKRAIGELGDDVGRGLRDLRAADHELKKYVDARVADALGGMERRMSGRLDNELGRVETALRRTGFTSGDFDTRADRDTPEVKAFNAFLRRGDTALDSIERKALTVSDDPRGGFLVPATIAGDVLRTVLEFDQIRQLARGVQTGGDKFEYPVMTSGPQAFWVGEEETRSSTDVTFGGLEIELGELACYIDVSMRLLEYSAYDLFNFMAARLGEAFALAEGTAFLIGNGVKKPLGILVDARLPKIASGNATAVTGDSCIDAVSSLKTAYSQNAVWTMNRKSFGALRKLKDTVGQYMFVESTGTGGLVSGSPGTLIGRPIVLSPTMPDIAAGSTPVLLGDFRNGYAILDKVGGGGLSILRDPYTLATVGKVRFHARLRVGGGMVQPEAMVAITVSA